MSEFNQIWNFSIDFRKNQIQNSIKICFVGAEFFHADRRRTDRHDEAIVALVYFVNATKSLFLPHRQHNASPLQRPNNGVDSESETKHINAIFGQTENV